MDTRIIDELANSGASIGPDKSCQDDDFVDRVNHTYTMNLLMFFTAIVLSRQLVGKPISCWIPNDFTGAQGEYAETVCWVTSTYFIPPAQATVPIEEDVRYEKKIYYYQWVPFILMIQAALFVVPCIVWRLFNTQSRINLRTVMEVSTELKCMNYSPEQRQDLINCLVRHLEDALAIRHFRRQRRGKKIRPSDQRHYGKGWSQLISPSNNRENSEEGESGNGNRNGGRRFSTPVVPLTFSKQTRVPGPRPCTPTSSAYLCGLYLAVKVLYLANSITQLMLTGKYLNGEIFIFGIEALRDLMNTRFWDQTGSFPRVALCDFELRRMGSNQHRYTIQCVLRINIFNEKIYIFLWFWFFLVSILNLLSLLKWCYKILLKSVRVLFIRNLICIYFNINTSKCQLPSKVQPSDNDKEKQKNQLSISDIFKTKEDLQVSRVFSEDILGQDGILLLRFINMNIGSSSAAELAGVIWIKYRKTAASLSGTTGSGLEDFIFTNLTANESERPPAIPPKRRRHTPQRRRKIPNLIPLNPLMHRNKYRDDNDSDRSSDSSRPTIEMLQERKRYKPMLRKRGHYLSDDEDRDGQMSAVPEDYAPEEFMDSHDILDADIPQEQTELMSEYRSFDDY